MALALDARIAMRASNNRASSLLASDHDPNHRVWISFGSYSLEMVRISSICSQGREGNLSSALARVNAGTRVALGARGEGDRPPVANSVGGAAGNHFLGGAFPISHVSSAGKFARQFEESGHLPRLGMVEAGQGSAAAGGGAEIQFKKFFSDLSFSSSASLNNSANRGWLK
ncbi:hypothetical protein NE237_018384 [Protea cynaroides]|uniref:Uncharacterized protein n=1 Tax=Protea cynaroides TaxID=273540 RepID=A0A9Q0QNV9_9MAGN|nr:hypothetical protein NE237_018384 [Protea cynaroides]